MEGGVLIEHSHRLVAATVTLLAFALMIGCWLRARRAARRAAWPWLGAVAFVLVLAQALLGGITVIFRLPTMVSTAHLAVSMLFFVMLIYIAFRAPGQADDARRPLPAKVQRMTLWGAVAVYVQMILGALMRHLGAGLACTDVPLCQGKLWPTGVHPNVTLHVVHRLFGARWCSGISSAWRSSSPRAPSGARSELLGDRWRRVLAVVQIALGILSVTTFLDVVPVTAHLGVAAAILADCVILHLAARGPLARARRTRPSRWAPRRWPHEAGAPHRVVRAGEQRGRIAAAQRWRCAI